MPERHLRNHGGEPTFLQNICKEPEQDCIPTESISSLFWKYYCKRQKKTICFHMEDYKLSHKDSKVNDEFINTLRDEYEIISEDGYGKMKMIRGKLNEYLGMTL